MQWQLEQTADALTLRLVPGETSVAPHTVVAALERALVEAGARAPRIDVEVVSAVTKTALGKAPLIKACRH
jgi:hypothetical protein